MTSVLLEHPQLKTIRNFLELSDKDRRISENLEEIFKDKTEIDQAIKIIGEFVNYFNLFNDLKFLKKEIVDCILGTLEICTNNKELMDSLLKTTLFRILEIFLDHSKIQGDKDKIIKTLSLSLEILAPSALIINLGMIAKPVFQDEDYQAQKALEAEEIEKIDHSVIADAIKAEVSNWIEMQQLNLEKQKELTDHVEIMVARLAAEQGLATETEQYYNLVLESKEMVNLKLTAMSLLMDFGDEDLSPQPLSL